MFELRSNFNDYAANICRIVIKSTNGLGKFSRLHSLRFVQVVKICELRSTKSGLRPNYYIRAPLEFL
jgi:hypothetical protein